MTFSSTNIDYISRGHPESILLCLPGWGVGGAMMTRLSVAADLMVVKDVHHKGLINVIKDTVSAQKKKIHVLGFSMGGMRAYEWLVGPESDLFESAFLLGVGNYTRAQVTDIAALINRNTTAYMRRFYATCFHTKEEQQIFKQSYLLKEKRQWNTTLLLNGLQYLSSVKLAPQKVLHKAQTMVVYSDNDQVISGDSLMQFRSVFPNSRSQVLLNVGHVPFLNIAAMKCLSALINRRIHEGK